MDIPSAVKLVLTAGQISRGSEIFIFKMPALRIVDLAEVMIEHYAQKFGFKPEEITIKFIGKRNGEKLFEDLMTEDEADRAYERDDMFIIVPHSLDSENPNNNWETLTGFKRARKQNYSSKNAPLISKEKLKDLINNF
jgi:FlaA1/EpsC-like NDP-sugar epimerase